jgi:D-amino-acid dehydrogenase
MRRSAFPKRGPHPYIALQQWRQVMRVCVLGAGIIGLATAWQLQREGHDVTVIDRAGPGSGASGGNGAQLSYAYVQPLADPAIWRQLPGLLLSRESPLQLRPRWDPHQWRWGLSFLGACRTSASRHATAQLLALAAESRAGFERFLAQENPRCDFAPAGKLVLYRDAPSFAAARRQLALQQSLGVQQWDVAAEECLALEPALRHGSGPIMGGIYTPGECVADCLKACEALAFAIAREGGRLLLGQEVQKLRMRGDRAEAALMAEGSVEADTFVVSLGVASHKLARQLGVYLPVYPLKGYSITVPASPMPGSAPYVSVTDAARKLVFARIGERLRVAGMAELVGEDQRIPAARIEALQRATREVFPLASDFAPCEAWSGLRPATPDGLPILGAHPRGPANVLFNTGHGALGFTLAFGSAQRLASHLRAPSAPITRSAAVPAPCSA